ncbi:MAG: 23S rRNA (pseudouridine(1915)-N(3))-methyltransferase RlmH [Crocinitomicaceae bacterium]|nr:23S rRNA (pseudouridine(1915)-N(3))-methyltransferase RlmH [Crocinitomicaceae bacterium]
MKIKLICVGKTVKSYLKEGEAEYLKRLTHYSPVEKIEISELKNAKKLSKEQIKTQEAQLILNHIKPGETIILLDEKGKQYRSMEFSKYLQKKFNSGGKGIVFIIGGAYGFSDEIYAKSSDKISLSQMTFSHQMVRLFFLEQIYRGFTILKGEPYHHE